jgi:predicted nucleic acid-binding protein
MKKTEIISNTGPLIALATIDRLDLLNTLFEKVIVPEAVHQELLVGGSAQAGINSYQQASWIKIEPLTGPLDPLLDNVLDTGEASVIQLAREKHIDRVLIDERKGRKIAREIYQLRVMGTAKILVEAKRHGLLENVQDVITQMTGNGYRIHDTIIAHILKEAGEL